MNHQAKVKLAKRLVTKDESYLLNPPSLFTSINWRRRKWAIMQRVKRQEVRARYHSEVRKGLRGTNI